MATLTGFAFAAFRQMRQDKNHRPQNISEPEIDGRSTPCQADSMNLRPLLPAFLLCLAMPHPACAQDQQQMNREAQAGAAAADKELNVVYKKLIATLDDEGKVLLKASQVAWLAYRDAEAKSAADEMRGGSAAPLLHYGSLARITNQRIAILRTHLGEDAPGPDAAPAAGEPAPPKQVIYRKGEVYAGSCKLYFTDAAGAELTVSVMTKAQRAGMAADEPFIAYPENMISIPAKGDSDANPAQTGKSFLLVTGPDGSVTAIKPAP